MSVLVRFVCAIAENLLSVWFMCAVAECLCQYGLCVLLLNVSVGMISESQLGDNQCPQILKKDNLAAGKESFFAFKRLGATIAWPSSMKHS